MKQFSIYLSEDQICALSQIFRDNEAFMENLEMYTEHSYINNLKEKLEEKPLIKTYTCYKCNTVTKVHILDVYCTCIKCGNKVKMYPYCCDVEYNVEALLHIVLQYLQINKEDIPSYKEVHP